MTINQQGDTPIRGIFFLLGGVFIFSSQDVLIKYLSNGYPLFEIMFIRSLAGIVPCLLIVHFDSGLNSLKTKRIGAHLLRSTLMFIAYIFYYLGIATLPLADAVALFFTAPFFVTVLSIIVVCERVKLTQWASLLIGFMGVLIIMSPGVGIFDSAAIFPIIAAFTYSCTALITRNVADSESASVIGFNMMVYFFLMSGVLGLLLGNGIMLDDPHYSLVFVTRAWIFPSVKDLGIMIGIGIFVSLGFFSLAQAYRVAKSSTITPFEYTGMVPAVLWGFVFWHEIPSPTTLIGILCIISSGLYLIQQQTRITTA